MPIYYNNNKVTKIICKTYNIAKVFYGQHLVYSSFPYKPEQTIWYGSGNNTWYINLEVDGWYRIYTRNISIELYLTKGTIQFTKSSGQEGDLDRKHHRIRVYQNNVLRTHLHHEDGWYGHSDWSAVQEKTDPWRNIVNYGAVDHFDYFSVIYVSQD